MGRFVQRQSMQSLHDHFQMHLDRRGEGSDWLRRILLAATLFVFGLEAAQAQVSSVEEGQADRAGEVVFVAGSVSRTDARGGTVAVGKGQPLREGDRIRTQVDGFIYVRMSDGGLLVVRPLSELKIDRWHFNPLEPQLSEIRYTLIGGVARYVSGRGSQAAKDKFRFNTPIAAIGVRGTDFTVFSEMSLTRVTVRVGGVVVSSFGAGCRADALGPCEGGSATELFASARDKMIQFRQGDVRPELVDVTVAPSPDKVRPPAPTEPVASRRPVVSTDVAIETYRSQQVADTLIPPEKTAPELVAEPAPVVVAPLPEVPGPTPPQVTPTIRAAWGRVDSALGSGIPTAALDDIMNGRSLIASNRYYALAGGWPEKVVLPNSGSVDFKLASHQGVVVDKFTNQAVDSVASNGFLRIDFGNRVFSTGFDLKAGAVSARIEGAGGVGSDGTLLASPLLSPTVIQGAVGGAQASEAVYIYQRALSKQLDAAGVASWGK